MNNTLKYSLIFGSGVAAIGGAIVWGVYRHKKLSDNIKAATEGTLELNDENSVLDPTTHKRYPLVDLRLTGYWPFTARDDEKKMEGGVFDRKMPSAYKDKPDSQQYKDHILHTVEQHLADPISHPFVSLSGDDAIWPYGQKLLIPWTEGRTIVGRVVDTGSHFRGVTKVYRVAGKEPIDVCVDSSKTVVPKIVQAQIVPQDNFEKGQPLVAVRKLQGQNVVLGKEVKLALAPWVSLLYDARDAAQSVGDWAKLREVNELISRYGVG